jgi:hypothetical protein
VSTALGLAAVAATLQQLLLAGFTKLNLEDVLGANLRVTCIAPSLFDRERDLSGLNLVLYNQTRNPGWFNEGLPSRDARGERTRNPVLALDLHYLIAAHGAADFHAEILLGAAMQLLHETPVLGRDLIRAVLKPAPNSQQGIPKQLETTGLADQIEQLRITPLNHSTDEVSRLWSALQVPGGPAAAYLVSVLLIESGLSTRVSLPVAARRLYALPLRSPRVDSLESTLGPATPIVPSVPVVLRGANLHANKARVFINGIDVTQGVTAASDASLTLDLRWGSPPAVPDELRAGVCTAQVSHEVAMGEPEAAHTGFDSNLGVFILNPEALFSVAPGATSRVIDGVTYRSGEISVVCTPKLGIRQRVRLLLNEKDPPSHRPSRSYTFFAPLGNGAVAPAVSSTNVTIRYTNVVAGSYLARLQVDDGVSALQTTNGTFSGPEVAP